MSQRVDKSSKNLPLPYTDNPMISSPQTLERGTRYDRENTRFQTKLKTNYRRLKLVNLYWLEKVFILVDFLQIFGLLWCSAQPWPWPYLWSTWTRWTVTANLDVFSLLDRGASLGISHNINISPWGEYSPGYLYYALAFSLSQSALILTLFTTHKLFDMSYATRLYKWKSTVTAIGMFLLHFIYLPVNLTLFRLYYCSSGVLAADPTVVCGASDHSMITAICSFLVLPVTIGLPIRMYWFIHDSVIYQNAEDHEKRLQGWELNYLFDLDDFYFNGHLWMTSSFRSYGAYYRIWILLYKLVLLFIFIFVRDVLYHQGFLFWFFIFLLFIQFGVVKLPYRCMSSNIVHFIFLSLLLISSSFGLANSFGVTSAVMVASTESVVLTCFHIFGFLIMFFFSVPAFLRHYYLKKSNLDFNLSGSYWPTVLTIKRIERNGPLMKKVVHWVEELQEAKEVRRMFLLSGDGTADIVAFEASINSIQRCWKSARKRGSIFELLLSEALEDMILLHSKKGPKSLRKNKKWDETYKNSLSNNYYKKRTEKYILMNPKKRKILFKLLAMKNLLKDHKRDSIYRKDSENGEEHSGDNSSQWGTGTDEGEGDGGGEHGGGEEERLLDIRQSMLLSSARWLSETDLHSGGAGGGKEEEDEAGEMDEEEYDDEEGEQDEKEEEGEGEEASMSGRARERKRYRLI